MQLIRVLVILVLTDEHRLERFMESKAKVNSLPRFARSNLNRFLQKTLVFLG